MKTRKRQHASAVAFLLMTAIVCFLVGREFRTQLRKEDIFPGAALARLNMLSDYFPALKNTPGDTEVYLFRGKEDGGVILILGGSHPNEPAGLITTVLLVENIAVAKGKVLIVPRANASGFSHSDPQEGNPMRFSLETAQGERFFRLGSRLTNPVHQWPDPAIYINPSGQRLAGVEARNLNRCYPGKMTGTLTEKVAYGIMELIRAEKIDLGVDIHESAPEYPVINAIVFHENSEELAALALMELQAGGLEIRLEASPLNLRGLSHREWGDQAGIKAILLETPNASHGRLKGKPSASLIVEGRDKFYTKAAGLGRLFVPYPVEGVPLKERVARHLAALKAILSGLEELEPEKAVDINGIPLPPDVLEKGIGPFLKPGGARKNISPD